MTNSFRKNVVWNTLGVGLNTFLSLFFMIIVTRINGLTEAGVFAISFSSACLLYIVGTYAGRIYQVTDNTKINDKEFIMNRVYTTIFMVLIGLIFLLFKDYSIHKNIVFVILVLYKALDAFCDVLYGVLQKNERLDLVGKSFLIKSILSVVSFVIIDLITKDIAIASLSMLIVCILITIFYDYKNVHEFIKIKDKINNENVKKIFKSGFLVFIISFITVFIVNIQKYVIDQYLIDDLQAIFGIIIMPATIISLFCQFVVHPILTRINKLCKEKKNKEILNLIHKMILLVVGFGLLCMLAAYIVGIPVLELIYNVDLANYKIDLIIVLLASTISVSAGLISPFLIAMRKNLIQVIIGIITIIVEIVLSIIFIKNYEIDGAVYAYLISMIVYAVLFFIAFYVILSKNKKGD